MCFSKLFCAADGVGNLRSNEETKQIWRPISSGCQPEVASSQLCFNGLNPLHAKQHLYGSVPVPGIRQFTCFPFSINPVFSLYIVASWLLRHQSRQVLITNFQDAVCKCVYVDCVGFISDVFAIVVQISDVKRSKLAIF